MKKEKKNELKNRTPQELYTLLSQAKERLEKMTFDLKSGKTANIKEIHSTKKEIAVILTIVKSHERTTKNN